MKNASITGLSSPLSSKNAESKEASKAVAALDGAKKMSSKFRSSFTSFVKETTSSTTSSTTVVPEKKRAAAKVPVPSEDTVSDDLCFSIGGEDDEDEDDEEDMELVHGLDLHMLPLLRKKTRVFADDVRSLSYAKIFFGHKRKKVNGQNLVLPRHLAIVGSYIVVLKESSQEDIMIVKSIHTLKEIARMTKFQKNTQKISLYFIQDKTKSHVYQLQERDAFINYVKNRMDAALNE